MKPLPVLLSIPHSGLYTPRELIDRTYIENDDLLDDSDAFTREIYDLGKKVKHVVATDIARAFVDVNRAPSDRPPANPDGVVKDTTCYGCPIYIPGREPDAGMVKKLLKRYYYPYHARLRQALKNPSLELALDCHSMASIGPAISPDAGQERPAICLGNLHGKTCSREMLHKLADSFRLAFSLGEDEVGINQPFAGGYIARSSGTRSTPWVQVELNRNLYLREPWFDRRQLTVEKGRLRELNSMFETALQCFFDKKEKNTPSVE